jgi:hypothetical protein
MNEQSREKPKENQQKLDTHPPALVVDILAMKKRKAIKEQHRANF